MKPVLAYIREVITEKSEFLVRINYDFPSLDSWYQTKNENFYYLTPFKVRRCQNNEEVKEHFNVTILQ